MQVQVKQLAVSGIKSQQGMTFIGMVIVVAAIVILGTIGMKTFPSYLEFNSVKAAIKKISNESNFNTMSKNDIAKAFDKYASVDDIKSVSGADLVVNKSSTGNEVSVEYQAVVPIFANASALLDFKTSSAD